MDEDSSTEQKTWQLYSFGKRNVLGYISISPERVSVEEEGRGGSFNVDGPKREKTREPSVNLSS